MRIFGTVAILWNVCMINPLYFSYKIMNGYKGTVEKGYSTNIWVACEQALCLGKGEAG